MNAIPNKNNLPNTILNLQKELGFSMTLKGARQVDVIDVIKIGSKKEVTKEGYKYPYYLIDFNQTSPEFRILGRSRHIYTKKQMEASYRKAQRKLAVFLFENESVSLE
jgi:hypothetical protein